MATPCGYLCKLVLGSHEMIRVKDVTINGTATEIDNTSRMNNDGWRKRGTGFKQWDCSFEYVFDPSDTALLAAQTAWQNNTELSVSFYCPSTATPQTSKCYISEFTRNEPLDDGVSVSIKLVGSEALK